MKKLLTAAAISAALGMTSATVVAAEAKHEVKPGETLHLISMQYGLGWKEVAQANDLESPNQIEAGMVLTIPDGAYQPVTKASDSSAQSVRDLRAKPLEAKSSDSSAEPKAEKQDRAQPEERKPAPAPAATTKTTGKPVAPPPPSGVVDRRASDSEIKPAVTQMYEVKPDATVEVDVSMSDVNRISIQGGKIEDVFGASEALLIEADKKRGQVFVRFSPKQSASGRVKQSNYGPASLFVSDDRGATYTVVMHPDSRSSTSVVLRPTFGQIPGYEPNKRVTGDTYPYQSRIMALVKTMYLNKDESDLFDATERGTDLTRWDGLPMRLVREWSGDGLNGREFFVNNVGNEPLTLMEADFAVKGVLAVSMTDHELLPGDSSRVFVIHQNLQER